MRKKCLLIILLIIIAAVIYLNRSYSYIYYKINQAGLKSPDISMTYNLGQNSGSSKKLTYVALGDSLTAGVGTQSYEQSYPYLVAKQLAAVGNQITLSDHSVPGATTAEIKNDLLPAAIQDQPDIVTVLAGVNDIHGNISLTEFKNNYEDILKRLTQETKAKIYLINIPYIGSADLMLPPYNYYFNFQTKRFNKEIKALAVTYKVTYIDLYSPTLSQFQKPGTHYSADSFHPSAQGYAAWAQIIYDHFNQ